MVVAPGRNNPKKSGFATGLNMSSGATRDVRWSSGGEGRVMLRGPSAQQERSGGTDSHPRPSVGDLGVSWTGMPKNRWQLLSSMELIARNATSTHVTVSMPEV
jgi:hypothetical protein